MKFITDVAPNFIITSNIFLLAVTNIHAANILFYIGGISTHSHRAGLEPLANKLAQNGHNITFFSPLKPIESHPNVTNFCPPGLKAFNDKFQHSFGVIGMQSRLKSKYAADLVSDYGTFMFDMGYSICEVIFKSKEFQKWVKESSFDLVVLDRSSIPDCIYGLAHKFGAKTISYTPISFILPWDSLTFGIPTESWWLPTAGWTK
ncbi:unnamed protein product [Allacma fusca]|uniref:Glucuronosyltransferase n=1 Tax=Allacma fusca TaxID=39272 RepID=A0A8J2PBS8_9HEXA|nr:unnamed protein product [Allacma fusca]